MLDSRTEKAIGEIVEDVRHMFGKDVVSVVLYGSAAGEDFVPGRSNVNFAIVLERVTFDNLKALHQYLPTWHKLGAATPLLLDRHFLERARDVFPMEFRDIQAQHRTLYGEEVFATLQIDTRHLRYQAEHEARGKLLRLRALYAEVGADQKRLEALMLDSVKTFVIIMRNFLRLGPGTIPAPYLQVIDEFETHFAVTVPNLRHVMRVKLEVEPWGSGVEDVFRGYLEEVERLIDVIDGIHLEPNDSRTSDRNTEHRPQSTDKPS